MRIAKLRLFVLLLAVATTPTLAAAQLLNPGFEIDDASSVDLSCATDWTCVNDVFTTSQLPFPRTGSQVLKTFGPFFGPGAGAFAQQVLFAEEGQIWSGEIHALNWTADAIQGNDFGFLRIEFLDFNFDPVAGGTIGVDTFESDRIDASTPLDVWTQLSLTTDFAPPGTVFARVSIFRIAADGFNGGSIFWDDVSLTTPFTDIGASLQGVVRPAVAWGDYDGDGDLDLLMAGRTEAITQPPFPETITKLYRNDAGFFTEVDAQLVPVDRGAVAWGDYDGDGDLDALISGFASNGSTTRIYRNDGGSFTDLQANLEGVWEAAVDWGDVDNDGDLDVLLAGLGASGAVTKVYRNDAGIFVDANAGLPPVEDGAAVAWGDVDGDGDLDVLLAGRSGSEPITRIYRNDSGFFTDVVAGLEGLVRGSMDLGDYDNDGDLDILIAGSPESGRSTVIYRNDPAGFTAMGDELLDISDGDVAWGDYDADGDLDVLLSGFAGGSATSSKIYRNDDGAFTDIGAGLSNIQSSAVAWGDYDNDGDLDAAVIGGVSGIFSTARIYRNESDNVNTPPTVPTGLSSEFTPGGVTFSWSAATDAQTPPSGLSYNLRVGTTPGGNEIFSGMADATTGFRRVARRGNVDQNLTWTLDLTGFDPTPSLYWSVQAIDTGFAGSALAPEVSLVPTAIAPAARAFALRQNHPNPFNPSTTIRFELAQAGPVRLTIFDVAGRHVRTLVQGTRASGMHDEIWRGLDDEGRPVASGVYLYELEAGTLVETRRMTLLK